MGQCASGLGLNKCDKFKKAIDILLKEKLQQGIFEAGFVVAYKKLYPDETNDKIENEDLQCMITYLREKLEEELNSNSTLKNNFILPISQEQKYELMFSNNRIYGITKSLEVLTEKFKNLTNSNFNTQFQKLEEKFNTSELIKKLILNDNECVDITNAAEAEAEAEAEIQKILREADFEIAMEFADKLKIPPPQTGGNTNQHKEDIKHLRKLLTNKKLTEKQKEQYLKKIDSIKSKIEKQNNKDKINKCKEHIKNLQKTLKNNKITEKQKQQCQHKISNYKLKMEELK
jgi:hypothetical protein